MSEIATTPNLGMGPGSTPVQVTGEIWRRGRTATAAALIGLIGAAVSLQGLPLFFLAASAPMSGLGLVLGLRHRNETAVLVGLTGIGLAAAGLF